MSTYLKTFVWPTSCLKNYFFLPWRIGWGCCIACDANILDPEETCTLHNTINSANKPGLQLQCRWTARVDGWIDENKELWRWITSFSVDFETQVFMWFLISMKVCARIITEKRGYESAIASLPQCTSGDHCSMLHAPWHFVLLFSFENVKPKCHIKRGKFVCEQHAKVSKIYCFINFPVCRYQGSVI